MWNRITHALYNSIYARTAGVVINSIVGGLLTNWLVADLGSVGKGVDWSRLTSVPAFWWLLGFLALFAAYTYGLYKFERSIYRWNEDSFVRARLREALVPVLLDRMKRRAKAGEVVTLKDLEKELLGE
jgi:hypothetical protein